MKSKKLVCIADLHCGQKAGLTPPKWWAYNTENIQGEYWEWYTEHAKKAKPDILVVNGDAIDGRENSVELVECDRSKQVEMAKECIEVWNPKEVVIVKGTPFHTGKVENWEEILSDRLDINSTVHDRAFIDIDVGGKKACTFDFRHFVAGSQVPHGRQTAIAREKLWNSIWAEADEQPNADWVVRSHVHYCAGNFHYVGQKVKWGLITPCLQLATQELGTGYGAKKFSGTVDTGFVVWNFIDDSGEIKTDWRIERCRLKSFSPKALKL